MYVSAGVCVCVCVVQGQAGVGRDEVQEVRGSKEMRLERLLRAGL